MLPAEESVGRILAFASIVLYGVAAVVGVLLVAMVARWFVRVGCELIRGDKHDRPILMSQAGSGLGQQGVSRRGAKPSVAVGAVALFLLLLAIALTRKKPR